MVNAGLTWRMVNANTRHAVGPDGTVEGITVKSGGIYTVSRKSDRGDDFEVVGHRRRYTDAKELLTLVYSVKSALERAEKNRGRLSDGDAATVAVETLLEQLK